MPSWRRPDVRQKLTTGEPLDFLAYVSTLVAALDPRAENPLEHASRQPVVTLPELVGALGPARPGRVGFAAAAAKTAKSLAESAVGKKEDEAPGKPTGVRIRSHQISASMNVAFTGNPYAMDVEQTLVDRGPGVGG